MLTINPSFLTDILVDLVRIDSTNPSLSPDGTGEAEISAYISQVMESLGLRVEIQELGEERFNVIGILKGSGDGRTLMWNAHMDTVGVEGMPDPFSAEIRAGRLYGRGSQDMKGSLGAMLAAVKALRDGGIKLAGDLILAAVADEEYASIGTAEIIKNYHADAVIVTEPTDLALCLAHRGFVCFDIETWGRAAHGSRYDLGIDAILHMGRILAELDHLERELRGRTPHPLAGPPSIHTSTIKGGTEMSIYPAHCHLQVERRTIPGESVESTTAELQVIVEQLALADPVFNAQVKPYLSRAPLEAPTDSEIIQVLGSVITQQMGNPPKIAGAPFWTDAALLAEAGIPSVLLGPKGGGLHTTEEWVDLESLADLAIILAGTALEFCRPYD